MNAEELRKMCLALCEDIEMTAKDIDEMSDFHNEYYNGFPTAEADERLSNLAYAADCLRGAVSALREV